MLTVTDKVAVVPGVTIPKSRLVGVTSMSCTLPGNVVVVVVGATVVVVVVGAAVVVVVVGAAVVVVVVGAAVVVVVGTVVVVLVGIGVPVTFVISVATSTSGLPSKIITVKVMSPGFHGVMVGNS